MDMKFFKQCMNVSWLELFDYFSIRIEAAETNNDPEFAKVLRVFFSDMQAYLQRRQ